MKVGLDEESHDIMTQDKLAITNIPTTQSSLPISRDKACENIRTTNQLLQQKKRYGDPPPPPRQKIICSTASVNFLGERGVGERINWR